LRSVSGIGTDRPGLFYDVFDKNFLNILPFWAIQYKILIKNVIKQPGPVQSGQGRSVPVGAGAGWCRSVPVWASRCRLVLVPVVPGAVQCRPVPTGAGAADRPQEKLYKFYPAEKFKKTSFENFLYFW
jgi:hypothetical protein